MISAPRIRHQLPTISFPNTTPSPQAQAIVQETTSTDRGAWSRVDAEPMLPGWPRQLPPRCLSSRSLGRNKADDRSRVGGGRSSANLEPDDRRNRANGKLRSGTADLTDPTKFIVQGEKRYWLHIALDRDDGTVLGTQLEEVVE